MRTAREVAKEVWLEDGEADGSPPDDFEFAFDFIVKVCERYGQECADEARREEREACATFANDSGKSVPAVSGSYQAGWKAACRSIAAEFERRKEAQP